MSLEQSATWKFVAPEFIFGPESRNLAGQYAKNFGVRKALVVTDPGVMAVGWTHHVIASLERSEISCTVFSKVTPNPRSDEVMAGAEVYESEHCNGIVVVGGAIFDTANDAIFVHDLKTGAILDVNRKMTEMYGYSVEEARNLDVEALSAGVVPYTQQDALCWLTIAAAGVPQLFEWLARDKSGRLFWVEVNLKRVTIGGNDRLLAIVRDITERKRAEEELRKAHDALEVKVEQRTAELAKANAELRVEITERTRAERAVRESKALLQAVID